MGIRVAFLAVQSPADAVLRFLSERYDTLPPASRTLDAGAAMAVGVDDGVLLVGEHNGLCLVLDPEFVLPSSGDLAVAVAHQLKCLAATLVTESITETHQFVIANESGLMRAFFYCGETGTGPGLLGSPLASEDSTPLNESTGGENLLTLLANEGLDAHPLLENGMWQVIPLPDGWTGVPSGPTPIATLMNAELDRITAVASQQSANPSPRKKSTGGWLKRLFGG